MSGIRVTSNAALRRQTMEYARSYVEVVGRGKVRQMLGMPNGTSDSVGMTRLDGGEAGQ